MALKKFKVHYKSDDGIEDYFEVESLDEATLRNEFASLHMGTILDAHEIGEKSSTKNKMVSTPLIDLPSKNRISQPEEFWTMITLHNGNVIKVSNTGRVQERFWEDIDLNSNTIQNELDLRLVTADDVNIPATLPKDIKFQRAVWKIMNSEAVK